MDVTGNIHVQSFRLNNSKIIRRNQKRIWFS